MDGTLQAIAKADFTEEVDQCGLILAFAVNDYGYHRPDASVGDYGGYWADVECIGGTISYRGDVALTRAQVSELIGELYLRNAEEMAAETYAEKMERA